VKTAISIPDATFQRAERHARELGMSRSELYSKAVERWLDASERRQITDQIDRALADAPTGGEEQEFLKRAAAGLIVRHEA
jgi:predicted transcriptional regulator